jgi:hypothetical protein
MTRFTPVCSIERSVEMRGLLKLLLIDLLMTRLASIAPQVFGGFTLLTNGGLFLLSRGEVEMDQHQEKDANHT